MKKKRQQQYSQYKGGEYKFVNRAISSLSYKAQYNNAFDLTNANDAVQVVWFSPQVYALLNEYFDNPTLFESWRYITFSFIKIKCRAWYVDITGKKAKTQFYWYRDRDCYWSPNTASALTAFNPSAAATQTTSGGMKQAQMYLKKGISAGFKKKIRANKPYRYSTADLTTYVQANRTWNVTNLIADIEGNTTPNSILGPSDTTTGVNTGNISFCGLNIGFCPVDTSFSLDGQGAIIGTQGYYTVEFTTHIGCKLWRSTDRNFNKEAMQRKAWTNKEVFSVKSSIYGGENFEFV